jgi:hypothetical protein
VCSLIRNAPFFEIYHSLGAAKDVGPRPADLPVMKGLNLLAAHITVVVMVVMAELVLQVAIVVDPSFVVSVVPVVVSVFEFIIVPATIMISIVTFIPVVSQSW